MCFDCLLDICLKNYSLGEEVREILSQMYFGILVKYPLFLSDFNESWTVPTDLPKIIKYRISWKSIRWELSVTDDADSNFPQFGESA